MPSKRPVYFLLSPLKNNHGMHFLEVFEVAESCGQEADGPWRQRVGDVFEGTSKLVGEAQERQDPAAREDEESF